MANSHYIDDFNLNVSRGLVKNTSMEHKFGAVPSMSVSTTGTVWDINDTLYPWTTWNAGADVINVERNNVADEGKVVTIVGLDANYQPVEETITIAGADTVGTTEFIRVFRAYVGDGSTNVGNIDLEYGAAGGTTVARITAAKGQTLMAVYTVPDGYNAYLTQGTASIKYGADCTIDMFVRYWGQTAFRIGHTGEVAGTGMPYNYKFTCPIKIPSRSDIDVRAAVRSNNARVTASFDMILIRE